MKKLMYNIRKGWFNMVKNKRIMTKFERQSVKKGAVNFKNNMKIMNNMYSYAIKLHDFKKDEFMVHEIDHIVKYAKAINRV